MTHIKEKLLCVCIPARNGCGNVFWMEDGLAADEGILCPHCRKHCSNQQDIFDLKNVDTLKDLGMDPRPARKMLLIEEIQKIDDDMMSASHERYVVERLIGPLPADHDQHDEFPDPGVHDEDDR